MINWIKNHRVLFAVIVVAFIGLGIGGMEITMLPSFCNSCHEMNRVCDSWKVASHADVGCMDCHAAPGLIGLLKAKASAMKSPVYHFFASEEKIKEALKHHTETPDSACLKCHPDAGKIVRVVNMLAPHEMHYKLPGADCQQCHENVAHCGAIPENDLQKHMQLCSGCHEKNASTKAPQIDNCAGCHVGQQEMLEGKGAVEVADSESLMPEQTCTDCHTDEQTFKPSEQSCVDCHEEGYQKYIKEWQDQVKPLFTQVADKYARAKAIAKAGTLEGEAAKAWEVGKANFLIVKHDGSMGVHNADYSEAILEKAGEMLDKVIATGTVAQK